MVFKAGPLRESHRAEFTLKRFFSRVNPRMLLQAHFLIERFPADGARKWTLLGVCQVVSLQVRWSVCRVETVLALVAQTLVISFSGAHKEMVIAC